MSYFEYFYTLFHFALQCFVGSFLFTFTLRKRVHFVLRILLCAIVALTVLFAMAGVSFWFDEYSWVVQTVCLALICVPVNVAWLAVCYEDSLWNILFCAVFGLLVRQGAINLVDILRGIAAPGSQFANLLAEENYSVVAQLVQYVIIIVVYVAVWLIFGRNYRQSDNVYKSIRYLIPIYIMVAFVTPVLTMVEDVLQQSERIWPVLLNVVELLFCFMVIAVQFGLNRVIRMETEKVVVDELLAQSQKQYDAMKENIDIINVKCHDMRHQLRALKNEGAAGNYIAELENSIAIYDSLVKTGNEALDVILTDKSLRCKNSDVQFVCMADGEKLRFMDETDINSLFGNAVENAIEYETEHVERDRRYISLDVHAEGMLLFINIENYFTEELTLKDGLPVTSKKDKNYHGFGVKSIRRVAEKYGGSMVIKAEDNLFKLHICIPLQ